MSPSFIFTLSVLFSLYALPMEKLFLVLSGLLVCDVIIQESRFRVNLFPGTGIYLYFLITGMAIGLYNMSIQNCPPRYVLKDMVYALFPFLFWLVGKNTAPSKAGGITNLFIAGTVVSCYDLAGSLLKIFQHGVSEMTLYQYRRMIGAGHPLTVITLFLYIYMPQNIKIKKKPVYGCIVILLADLLIHFSRITLLNTCIFLLYLKILKSPVKFFSYAAGASAGLAAAYGAFPAVFHSFMERLANSLTEISHANDPWNHIAIVTNWRGYEVYCELQKFRQAGMIEQILGGGFGAQLDVQGKAYLVTTEPTLPFLHNGYFSILMIWGISGCAAYILLLIALYLRNRVLAEGEKQFWKALVMIIAVDTIFVHGLFFSTGIAGVFLYLGVLEGVCKTTHTTRRPPMKMNF